MKAISLKTKQIYDIFAPKTGENMLICPECSHDRKKKNQKSLKWNETKSVGHCFHCETSFVEYKPFKQKKEYKAPEWQNNTELSEEAVKYFEGRMISQKVLVKMGVFSKREFMPQFNSEVKTICFPYYFGEKLVNIKYRAPKKTFKLYKDAELIFYNLNAVNQFEEIIIVEGEIDCLSFICAGYENCISVPNGGGQKQMEYLDNYFELFDNKKIILATDNDIKGIELRDELLRRFGQERCKIVNFQEYKDANEVLCEKGGLFLADLIKNAKEIPISGIIDLENYYDDIYQLFLNGMQPGANIQFPLIDEKITWETGRLAIWTGIPGHGKSEALDWFNVRLNLIHGWKVAYFSPENWPVKYHYSKLATKIHGQPFKNGYFTQEHFEQVFEYIENNYFFIQPDEVFTIESIIEKAIYLVKKQGIKILNIDPYNKLDHKRNRNESETEYVSRFLDLLSNFAKKYDVLVNLVAHPRKMDKNPGRVYECPNLYDINGSANFYNKADYGISIYRNWADEVTEFHFIKIKFRHLGVGGMITMKYNLENSRYEYFETPKDQYDFASYICQNTGNSEIQQNNDFSNEMPF